MLAMFSATTGFAPAQDNVQAPMHPAAAAAAAAAGITHQNSGQPHDPWSGAPPAGKADRQLADSMLGTEWHS
jgi:hypothetical protein